MLESLIVVAGLGVMLVLALAPAPGLIYGGVALALGGVLIGAIAGFVYHVLLHRHLAPRGELQPRWWWNPVPYNKHLQPEERRRTMPWFYVGAAAWVTSMLGCVGSVTGMLRTLAS